MAHSIIPTNKELFFDEDDIIVSKTNTKGHLTYANDIFLKLAGFNEKEVIGKPHSIIRHPDMPRCIFKLLWDRIQTKKEVFAYVKNMSRNGDHYWVLAHVTPSFDSSGNITSYHSNRRVPNRNVLENIIIPMYTKLLEEEQSHKNKKDGMNKAYEMLENILQEQELGYDEFIFSHLNEA